MRAAERVFRQDSTVGMEVSEITEGRARGSYISHHEIERRLVGDGVRAVIVSEFCMEDRFGP